MLASLNHPNIAAIHGLEDSGETRALVLELVEGPTLADRIAQGPIPVDEARPIARQIADALEAAHEQGIIHRDLKPANIKLRPDGTVKVLDFGLAKALEGERAHVDRANSPTLTATASQMGVIMGTVGYMSPERANGQAADKRADVWAFGAVLYEMLTGNQAFAGDQVTDTLVAVLRAEVDLDALPAETPATIRQVVRACLQRDPKQRVHDVADVRLAMEGAFEASAPGPTNPTESIVPPALLKRPVSALLAAVTLLAVGSLVTVVFGVRSQTPSDPPLVVRMPIALGEGETFTATGRHAVAISRDGSHLAYSAGGIVLRPVGQLQARLIPGTSAGARESGQLGMSGRGAFFSPDGQWLGYWQQGQLRKVALTGGAPIALADIDNPHGATWGDDDTILFGQGSDGIWRVAGAGGTPEPLISVEDGEAAHGPQMLPGGDWVLFTLRPSGRSWDEAQIVAQSLATGERQVLAAAGRDGRYVATGHLVYLLEGVLFAVPLDVETREVTGGPVSLVEGVSDATYNSGAGHFAVSQTGSLVYLTGLGPGGTQSFDLIWVDRTGNVTPVGAEPRAYRAGRVSPDGTRLVVYADAEGNLDIWTYDLARGAMTRLTFDSANDSFPVWTPDGSRVVFTSTRDRGGLFWTAADGTGETELLLERPYLPYGWTPDGRLFVFQGNVGVFQGGNIGVVTVEGDRRLDWLLDEEFNEAYPTVSPNGRWLAYQSDESGQAEVYVRPFPDVDAGKWQVSVGGGRIPLWSPDGAELFFADGRQFMVAGVEGEPTFRPQTPERLFDLGDLNPFGWDVAPDGERFLFRRPSRETGEGEAGLVLVLNWFEELKARVPTGADAASR